MLLSMTGQGQGRRHLGSTEITCEVRAVNNRHLKLQMRLSEGLSGLEPRIEATTRNMVRRGSLQLSVQLSGSEFGSAYSLQPAVIEGYVGQSRQLAEALGIAWDLTLRDLLQLPGAVAESRTHTAEDLPDELVDEILNTVTDALACLNRMRRAEGDSMTQELMRQLEGLRELTDEIQRRCPVVIEQYRVRLQDRLSQALEQIGVDLKEGDTVREVLLMTDKVDVREEIVRLRSHFDQFHSMLDADQSQGRKLDFLIQEMFREANTIGSKAGDADVAQRVVDIKTSVEQMRELVQNVE